jgi:hypothetical protein
MSAGLKIGVTVAGDVADAHAALWSNGITQNVVFLAGLLRSLPSVDLTALVAVPDGARPHPIAVLAGVPALSAAEAVERLDVIIELGARAPAELMQRFRDRGGRLVSYMAGNVMAMNFEAVANGSPGGDLVSEVGFDAVWITPQHWRMNRAYAAMTRSPRVRQAPHLWTPRLLEQSAASLGLELRRRPRAPGQPWRIGVFDPNVNVLKTFHLPLLACEEAHRLRPGLIDRVLLFGAERLKGVPHFEEFVAATDLGREGRVFAEARHPLASVLGRHIDAVVTHQWENGLNYLYWDVLYAGYPLVHNATEIAEVGAHYGDFDPQAGGAALVEALENDGFRLAAQRESVKEVLWRYDSDNPAVQRAYADLLDEVMA